MDLLPDTIRILNTMAAPISAIAGTAEMTSDEFIKTYSVVQEDTSTSPSGHHTRHYKAALKDPSLVSLHAIMMSIPSQIGFAPDRWKQVTDIMLEKEEGNSCCHTDWS